MSSKNDPSLLTPDTDDFTSPDSDAVLAYMKEREKAQQQAQQAAEAAEKAEAEKAAAEQEHTPKPVDVSNGPVNMTFGTDSTFEQPTENEFLNDVFVSVNVGDFPVTPEDQTAYIKALLNDEPVILTTKFKNGLSVTCRALSSYELDLVMIASQRYVEKHSISLLEAAVASLQACRVVMQVTHFAGKPMSYKQFKFVAGETDIDKEADRLLAQTSAYMDATSSAKFALMVKGLNIFEHKLYRLNELALSRDFSEPVD